MKKIIKMFFSITIVFALSLGALVGPSIINTRAASSGFVNEQNVPVNTKVKNLDFKFNTQKEPYKAGRNLLNIAYGFNSAFTVDTENFDLLKLTHYDSGYKSEKIPVNLIADDFYTLSLNILDKDVEFRFAFYLGEEQVMSVGFEDIGFSVKTLKFTRNVTSIIFYIRPTEAEGSFVTFTSIQLEKGEQASAYVPYYYAPAVNGVRVFTDSVGGYLGYKTFDDVIAYGYFGPTVEKIFWANDIIEYKGVFEEGWQLSSFSLSNIYDDDTYILYYSDNYQLHYNDTVYVELKDDTGYFGFLKNGFNSVFGDNVEPGAVLIGILLVVVGIAIVKKILK